ncbi:hypothetical protein P8452_48181 [Trifolium repens]|nr:hypothetical protein P8452_48181 [Trifolium repens]
MRNQNIIFLSVLSLFIILLCANAEVIAEHKVSGSAEQTMVTDDYRCDGWECSRRSVGTLQLEMVIQSLSQQQQQHQTSFFVHHHRQQQAMGEASAARVGNHLLGHLNLLSSLSGVSEQCNATNEIRHNLSFRWLGEHYLA